MRRVQGFEEMYRRFESRMSTTLRIESTKKNPTHSLLILELLLGAKIGNSIIENMFGHVINKTQMNTSVHQIKE